MTTGLASLRRWAEDVLNQLYRAELDLLRERGIDDSEHIDALEQRAINDRRELDHLIRRYSL